MTTWQIFCAFLSLAMAAYVCGPALSGLASRAKDGAVWLFSRSGQTTLTTPTKQGEAITAEQAQAAELVLSRFIAKADKNDPTFKLIANGIKTLAETLAPEKPA